MTGRAGAAGLAFARALSAPMARADDAVPGFNGTWTGQGVVIRDGETAPCAVFQLSLLAGRMAPSSSMAAGASVPV